VFKVSGLGTLRTLNPWAEFGVCAGGDIGRAVPRPEALGHGVLSEHVDSASVCVSVCVSVCEREFFVPCVCCAKSCVFAQSPVCVVC
jgi:hypothetical protein